MFSVPQTTYIFGAGASKHAGYPLASTMGRDLIEAMRGSGDQTLSGYAELAVETFGETPNVEDLFTSLQARINKAGTTAAPDGELPNLRSALLYRIGAWFRQIRGSAPAYQAFASRIASPGDTVLTFNYDDSVEKELNRSAKWNLSTGYGFPFSSSNKPSDVMVLKTTWQCQLACVNVRWHQRFRTD